MVLLESMGTVFNSHSTATIFSRFNTIHERDSQPVSHRTTAKTALCIASRGKSGKSSKIQTYREDVTHVRSSGVFRISVRRGRGDEGSGVWWKSFVVPKMISLGAFCHSF